MGFTTTTLDRVWVQATVSGSQYLFDPAFKRYTEITGIGLKTAMGYFRADLLSAAGGTLGTDDIQNMDYSGLGAKLSEYSANLAVYLRGNLPNAKIEQVIGGQLFGVSLRTGLIT